MRAEAIRTILDRLGYEPIVRHLQRTRTIDHDGQQRITTVDFLAAPAPPEQSSKVKVAAMRMRPPSFNGLHAYVTPGAFSIEEELLAVDVSDDGSDLLVYPPHPFTYLILKLVALRDRLARADAGTGKYHALDMLTIWSLITEPEWAGAERLRNSFADHPIMADVRDSVEHLFGRGDSPGTVALRDQARLQRIALTGDAAR